MSTARLSLAVGLTALFLAATAPVFLFQESAGNPDDVAQLFPRDTAFFAELVRPPKLLKEWQEFVGAYCTADGKKKVCEMIEKAVTESLEIVPDKLRKDFEKGLPSIQRVALVVAGADVEDLRWAVVATSSDKEFVKTLVEKHLQVFAAEEQKHAGGLLLVIKRLGEMKFPEPLLVAGAGNRLIVTTHGGFMAEMLDRAAGKGRAEDLRANPMYRRLGASTGEDPALRAFYYLDWPSLMGGPRGSRRSSVHQLDMMNAALGMEKIRGITVESSLRPGRVAARTRIYIDPPCRLYDAWRQPAGPKETLKYIPADAALAAHVNVKDAKELWANIQDIIRRVDAAQAMARGDGARRRSEEEQFKQEMERGVGFGPEELAAVVGNEAAFAFAGEDPFANDKAMIASMIFVMKVTDAAKAKGLAEKFIAKMGQYETKTEGDATFYVPPNMEHGPALALQGQVALIGGAVEKLREALKAPSGKNVASLLPAEAASASKLVTVEARALWALLKEMFRGDLPDLAKDLNLSARSTLLITEEKDVLTASSTDAGLGILGPGSVFTFPMLFVARPLAAHAHGGIEAPRRVDPPRPEPPALPKDKLAAEVNKQVQDLRSENLTVRDDAAAALRKLGRQAVPNLVEAVKKETDVDARAILMQLLADWKAYDAFPELVNGKVQAFITEFEKLFPPGGDRSGWGGFAVWPRQEGYSFPWGMEPYSVNDFRLLGMEHREVLEMPLGLKRLAERVEAGKLNPDTQRNLAAVLAFTESSAAFEEVLKAHGSATDPQTRQYLRIALGWSSDPRAREVLSKGFKDSDRWLSRASFIGADRSRDAGLIPPLLDLLKDPDGETRWNASYTLRVLTGSRISVNVFLPEEEQKAALAAARAWWEKNKETFRIVR